jgi:Fe-S cluster biogenesis protein NfuA/rhodanese-related sulfurtransferase
VRADPRGALGPGAPRQRIAPDWTLGRLKEVFPGVELTLYAFFGVGSRERSGFAASETLADLLRRHLVFDAEKACARLDALAEEDWRHEVEPLALRDQLAAPQPPTLLDARSADDFARSHLPGSQLLSAQAVASLRSSQPPGGVVLVCDDGSQSPAASRLLRGQGFPARHLAGGLRAWSISADETFPINYPLEEVPGRWHLIADGATLRYRRPSVRGELGWRLWDLSHKQQSPLLAPLLRELPGLTLVASTPRSFAARGQLGDLHQAARILGPWLEQSQLWESGGLLSEPEGELARLETVLRQEAPAILKNHKGTVEIEGYHDRVLTLRLGGGCAGCASASITTQRELAAALYREVPLLDRIQGES